MGFFIAEARLDLHWFFGSWIVSLACVFQSAGQHPPTVLICQVLLCPAAFKARSRRAAFKG